MIDVFDELFSSLISADKLRHLHAVIIRNEANYAFFAFFRALFVASLALINASLVTNGRFARFTVSQA